MTTVACIKVGNKYSSKYVNRLAEMVASYTDHDYQFVCLTDNQYGIIPKCLQIETLLPGWWSKLVLFKPQAELANDRILYLDLDTVIVDAIDFLFTYKGDFAILDDFWAPTFNSSIMSIAPGFGRHIWERFQKDPDDIMASKHGDQDWITACVREADIWQRIAPGRIGSYKADQLAGDPKDFAVVCFHGDPKPHEIVDGWVYESWH